MLVLCPHCVESSIKPASTQPRHEINYLPLVEFIDAEEYKEFCSKQSMYCEVCKLCTYIDRLIPPTNIKLSSILQSLEYCFSLRNEREFTEKLKYDCLTRWKIADPLPHIITPEESSQASDRDTDPSFSTAGDAMFINPEQIKK